jgi:hypothetical protein
MNIGEAQWYVSWDLQNKVYIKGEIAEPCASTRIPPTRVIKTRIGNSQYLLRTPKKRKNSVMNSMHSILHPTLCFFLFIYHKCHQTVWLKFETFEFFMCPDISNGSYADQI